MPDASPNSRPAWPAQRSVSLTLLVLFLIACPIMLLLNVAYRFDLDPSTPNPEQPKAHALWIAFLWVIVVVPAIGVCLRAGRMRSAWVALVVGGLLVNGVALLGRDLDRSHRPTPPAPVTQCQEHSGGDTRCPGG